jgi:predicted transposase/invertase (TIGR01784 family)
MESLLQNSPEFAWGPFPFGDGQRILDIRYDPVFKAVFTRDNAESRKALSGLISALIGRTVTVEAIVANEPAIDYMCEKKIRYDIRCKSKDGEPINVEMLFHPVDDELNRLEYYASKLLVGQDIAGIEKSYSDLKETYQISILAQRRFFPDKYLTHAFQFYDPEIRVSLDGKIRIITLELEKSAMFIDKPVQEMSRAEIWAAFFQYLTNGAKREIIKEIIAREEGIAMAINALCQITANEEEDARLTTALKNQLDWKAGIVGAERRGRREGMAKGRAESILEVARKMKNAGRPSGEIVEFTGLSPEEIAKL